MAWAAELQRAAVRMRRPFLFSIPEERKRGFGQAGLLASLHPPVPFPCARRTVDANVRPRYSCGDSAGFAPASLL